MILSHLSRILAFYEKMRQKLKNVPQSNPAKFESDQKKNLNRSVNKKEDTCLPSDSTFWEFFVYFGCKTLKMIFLDIENPIFHQVSCVLLENSYFYGKMSIFMDFQMIRYIFHILCICEKTGKSHKNRSG